MSAVMSRRPATAGPPPGADRLTRMAWAYAVLFLEVEQGLRPRQQLRGLMCPVLYLRLSEVWVRADGRRTRVRALHAVRPTPGQLEVVAVVDRGTRVGALGFRLRRRGDGWRVDDLVRPELGPLPDPPFPMPSAEEDADEIVVV